MTLITHRRWRSRLRRFRTATRGGLLPVVSLYWRRRKRPVAHSAARRSRAPVAGATTRMTFVSMHQHLHPSTRVSGGGTVAPQAVPVPAGAAMLMTRITHRLVEKRVAAAATGGPLPVDRRFTPATTTRPVSPAPEAPAGRRGSRSPAGACRTSVIPVVGRLFARTVPLRSTGGPATPPPSWPKKPRVTLRSDDPVAGRGRRVARAGAPGVAAHQTAAWRAAAVVPAATRVRAVSSVAMDWRAAQGRAVSPTPAAAIAAADRAVARVAPAPLRPEASAEQKASVPRERAVPLALDSSTIDRLADNVMQRIDRRIRIERERRGL